jgi:cyclophilin family peptidyl-prolyl cis-trans isomerase
MRALDYRRLGLAGLPVAVLLLAGCGSVTPMPVTAPAAARPDDQQRALLLLLEDRRQLDPYVVERAQAGPPPLRLALARALGRIADSAGLPTLELLLFDPADEVRRGAAFALGELGAADGTAALLRALTDPDHEVGTAAVEALGKLGRPLSEVVPALVTPRPGSLSPAPLDPAEQQARLLPYLFRFHEEGLLPIARHGLELSDPYLHARAAYALSREPFPAARDDLRGLLADADPWVRAYAARAIGIVGEAGDLARLRPLLDDPAPGPIVQALRAAKRLIGEARASADDAWVPRLLALAADPRPGVRITALDAAGAWRLPTLADLLHTRATGGVGREREVALLALAESADPRASSAVTAAASGGDATLRTRAAEAAAKLPVTAADVSAVNEVLSRLAVDTVPGVRVAALGARLARAEAEPAAKEGVGRTNATLAAAALGDPDPVVRATILDWAVEHPVLRLETLTAAVERARADRDLSDAALSAVDALAARSKAEVLERGGALALLDELAADPRYLVRRRASKALADLGQAAPPVGPVDTGRDAEIYQSMVSQTSSPREVDVETSRGTLRLRLACPEAPLTCLSFLKLAGSGYFDGQTFHRVVPDFVVQGGDPRGDGSGGPGYEIRDEINPLRYDRGAVGMALSGPDTGGSQFFITLSAQPHLDGGYTVFGHVVAGDEILDQIVQGDRIVRITEVAVAGRH